MRTDFGCDYAERERSGQQATRDLLAGRPSLPPARERVRSGFAADRRRTRKPEDPQNPALCTNPSLRAARFARRGELTAGRSLSSPLAADDRRCEASDPDGCHKTNRSRVLRQLTSSAFKGSRGSVWNSEC